MKTSDSRARIKFQRHFPFGLLDENRNPASRLFIPFRQIIETGKPIGTINPLFLRTAEPLPSKASRGFRLKKLWNNLSPTRRAAIYQTLPRLLGTLCHTATGMLLFFPGYGGTFIQAYNKSSSPGKPFPLDHLTLEPQFGR